VNLPREPAIRRATSTDAQGIAEVHVLSWQWAYRGIIPDSVLDGLSVDARTAGWRGVIDGFDVARGSEVWVGERDGRVAGFVLFGPTRDEDGSPDTGEVYAIYLIQDAAGSGLGRRLLALATDRLRSVGFNEATLWVVTQNQRARRFYERAGWRADGGTKEDDFDGAILEETRYRAPLIEPA
jgi:GNAT superfamily N-acetyltransferase